MKKATLTALKESIEKWEKIVARTGVDDGDSNCALCQRFGCEIESKSGRVVERCPVVRRVRMDGCIGTPYSKWADHQWDDHKSLGFPHKVRCNKCEELAQKELDFLKSLLP